MEEILAIIVTVIVTIASLLATITPSPQKGTVYYYIYTVIQWLALNFGRAKNAQDNHNQTGSTYANNGNTNGK